MRLATFAVQRCINYNDKIGKFLNDLLVDIRKKKKTPGFYRYLEMGSSIYMIEMLRIMKTMKRVFIVMRV